MRFPEDPSTRFLEALLDAIPEPFLIIDEEGYYVDIVGGADGQKYHDGKHLVGKRMHEVMDAGLADQFLAEVRRAIESRRVVDYVYQLAARDLKGSEELPGPEGKLWFEAHISPIREIEGRRRMVAWIAFNITELKQTIQQKEALIGSLQKAIGEIKTLRGILPICSYCKKIRDDQGYWNQLEAYLNKHSGADLSHGVCPDCAKVHYPDLAYGDG